MKPEQIESIIKQAIIKVAPDADPEQLSADDDMREELELDSMDFLNIIIAVSKTTGTEIAEADYGQLVSMEQMITYVMSRQKSE